MRAAAILLIPALLSGCAAAAVATAAGPTANVVTQATRAAAKTTVNRVAESRFPGVPIAPISDCVIDNASVTEILTLARAAATQTPTAQTAETVVAIVGRPETIQCLTDEGLPRILGAGAPIRTIPGR